MSVKLFTAASGEGKTSFLQEYAARTIDTGWSVGGIASPAVFQDDRRIGYDLLDLRSGSRRVLARVVTTPDVVPTVGPYQFDQSAIIAGNAAIIAAVRDGLDMVAIDEVGPLEFRGQGWAPALEVALREGGSLRELIVVVRPSLVDKLPDRFPSPHWLQADRVSPPWPSQTVA